MHGRATRQGKAYATIRNHKIRLKSPKANTEMQIKEAQLVWLPDCETRLPDYQTRLPDYETRLDNQTTRLDYQTTRLDGRQVSGGRCGQDIPGAMAVATIARIAITR